MTIRRAAAAALALAAGLLALGAGLGCSGAEDAAKTDPPAKRRSAPPRELVAALAPLPDGGLRVGELRSGRIVDVLGPRGRRLPEPRPVGRVAVSTGGQRGLLGLTVDRRGRTFAAYTDMSRRIAVAQVGPGRLRRVWSGPQSAQLANGGHLEASRDGRSLLIGIGDLQRPSAAEDPQEVAGSVLALDPDGPPDQRPRTLSRGWNNPFAFTQLPQGGLLVADNAPGARPERIARGDSRGGPPRAITALGGRRAPSAVVATAQNEIALCGVVSGRLERLRAGGDGRWRPAGALGSCRYGAVLLADGRIAVSRDSGIAVVSP